LASGGARFKGTLMVASDSTQLGNDFNVPSVCKEILAITPYGIPTTRTADVSMMTALSLSSTDTDVNPTSIQVLIAPLEDATVTAASNSMIFKTYDLHVPVNGGDVIQAFGKNTIDATTDPYFGANILISDIPSGRKQVFWTAPTAISLMGVSTNDSFVDGSTYRWNNSARIVNTYGIATGNGTRTVTDSSGGNYKLQSNDFRTNLPQIYNYQTMFENDLAAGNNQIPTTLLWDVNVPTDPVVSVVEAFAQEGLTLAADSAFISGVGYNKIPTRRG